MKARTHELLGQMVSEFRQWVKSLMEESKGVVGPSQAGALERRVRGEGQAVLGRLLQRVLQLALDRQRQQARRCPACGRRCRHKGVRERGLLSTLGAIRLRGPYWYCPACRTGRHSVASLAPGSSSRPLEELLCLLGTALASFDKAGWASQKLLGVRVADETIRRLCQREGVATWRGRPEPPRAKPGSDLIGSCDGTMVNTREGSWRELKAYQFRHAGGRHGQAFLESSKAFGPRLRRTAIGMGAAKAGRVFFVSDAADWIDKQVAVQLPDAIRIVDIWHAYQHVHEASRKLFGEGTAKAQSWAKRYCEELRVYGGRPVWHSLRRVRYKDPPRQQALEALLTYLDRQAERLDYPTYEYLGYPISNGQMESFCKQLGQRLKGPGMRWSVRNVDSMAALVSLWSDGRWDSYWQSAA
jgi:hypothetical protein